MNLTHDLADADSQFLTINGLEIHVKTRGQGLPAMVLLHGFASNLGSWAAVMEPLSRYGLVIAYDRPAFGLTERPLTWQGQNPYGPEAQVELLRGLLEAFGVQQAILVGNSAGGTVALQTALAYPERVRALVLVDAMVYTAGGPPGWVRPLLSFPPVRSLGLLATRRLLRRGPKLLQIAWHDPAKLTPEIVEAYENPLRVANWDRALWEFTLASRPPELAGRLKQVTQLALVISGDDDRIVPTADSQRLAQELPSARLAVIKEAGHVPQEEQPQDFMQAVEGFLGML